MAKKITVEVDAETTKAKRKVQELAHLADSPDGGTAAKNVARDLNSAATAAKKIAEAMDKQSTAAENAGSLSKAQADHLATASSAAKKLAYSTYEGNANLRAMTKVFGGMAIRMATSYAAQSMEQGSAARVAVDAGGAAIAGALQGSVAGPIGALAGGIMGLTQALMEANAEETARKNALYETNMANREQLETMLAAEERTDKFRATLEALTSAEDGGVRRMEAQALLAEKRRALDLNADELTGQSAKFDGDDKKFRSGLAERAALKTEISQLESLLDRKDPKKPSGELRMSLSALDSLARVGGNFAGGEHGFRDLQRVNEKQVALLEKIEAKTGKGAGKF